VKRVVTKPCQTFPAQLLGLVGSEVCGVMMTGFPGLRR